MTGVRALLLFLQVAAYQQASLPTKADSVIIGAAESLENVLGLDYEGLRPMLRNIDVMKKRMVELMPHLEEAERPVITTAFAKLLDLEGTLKVDFGTTLGLLTDKTNRYGKQMTNKIKKYPGKLKSSLRTLKSFLETVSNNVDDLVETSEQALTQAKTVLISIQAFQNMMKVADAKDLKTQTFETFLEFSNLSSEIILGAKSDPTFEEAISLVENLIPKVVDFGAGLFHIQETPDLNGKVDQIIVRNGEVIEEMRNISTGLRNAKKDLKTSLQAVDDLKENSDRYNTEDMEVSLIQERFEAVTKSGENLGKTVAFATGYQPNVYKIPEARITTTTTTTTTTTSTTTTSTTTASNTSPTTPAAA